MKPTTESDRQARQIIKALEPTLRRHLGPGGVERRFVTGLYWRLRQSLEESGGFGSRTEVADLQRLAFDVFLSAATYLEGCEVTPALLCIVRRNIENTLVALAVGAAAGEPTTARKGKHP